MNERIAKKGIAIITESKEENQGLLMFLLITIEFPNSKLLKEHKQLASLSC